MSRAPRKLAAAGAPGALSPAVGQARDDDPESCLPDQHGLPERDPILSRRTSSPPVRTGGARSRRGDDSLARRELLPTRSISTEPRPSVVLARAAGVLSRPRKHITSPLAVPRASLYNERGDSCPVLLEKPSASQSVAESTASRTQHHRTTPVQPGAEAREEQEIELARYNLK